MCSSDLLGLSPGPRVVLLSEEDNGCDDVGVVRNELAVKVCRAKEGAYSLDRGRRVLCGLHNQISSSAHSSVVQGHVEFQGLLEGATASEGPQVLSSNCYQERRLCPEDSLGHQGWTPSRGATASTTSL